MPSKHTEAHRQVTGSASVRVRFLLRLGKPILSTREQANRSGGDNPFEIEPITAKELLKQARKAREKAPGAGAWKAEEWWLLPSQWWHKLAHVWNQLLTRWLEARVTLLPKDDGGHRPLTIASLAWRAGATALVNKLKGWTGEWATAELMGGLSGRGIGDCRARLMAALNKANGQEKEVVCITQDITKAFDSVSPTQAITIADELGLPIGVANVLKCLHGQSMMIFCLNGVDDSCWRRANRGLI